MSNAFSVLLLTGILYASGALHGVPSPIRDYEIVALDGAAEIVRALKALSK